jgi:hypothetical protein
MAYATKSIASRIEWCQRQKTQAHTLLEREGWQAEEEGLQDALLNRVHTNQLCPLGVFKRYVIGFQDGVALIRAGAVDQHVATPDVSTIHVLGRTRRGEPYV